MAVLDLPCLHLRMTSTLFSTAAPHFQWRHTATLSFPTVVTIGNFDGVHRGHQSLLQITLQEAHRQQACPAVLTFEPPPPAFFHPERPVARLTSLREKLTLLRDDGMALVYVLRFNQEVAQWSPQYFMEHILKHRLRAVSIVIGEDFYFGCGRAGNSDTLKHSGLFETVHVLPPLLHTGTRISSTRVRETMAARDMATVSQLLGRPFSMEGRVIPGDQRGRQLGFPTANIHLGRRIPPLQGVFAVQIHSAHGDIWQGVANVGKRPTVAGERYSCEVHVFNFSGNLYGQHLRIMFLHALRAEQKFSSLEALTAQIHQDVIAAKQWLHHHGYMPSS